MNSLQDIAIGKLRASGFESSNGTMVWSRPGSPVNVVLIDCGIVRGKETISVSVFLEVGRCTHASTINDPNALDDIFSVAFTPPS